MAVWFWHWNADRTAGPNWVRNLIKKCAALETQSWCRSREVSELLITRWTFRVSRALTQLIYEHSYEWADKRRRSTTDWPKSPDCCGGAAICFQIQCDWLSTRCVWLLQGIRLGAFSPMPMLGYIILLWKLLVKWFCQSQTVLLKRWCRPPLVCHKVAKRWRKRGHLRPGEPRQFVLHEFGASVFIAHKSLKGILPQLRLQRRNKYYLCKEFWRYG